MNTQLSWRVYQRFSRKNSSAFCFQDVLREFPDKRQSHLSKTLSDMVKKGMLCKIHHNNYHIIPSGADPGSFLPDGPQIAKNIMQKSEYYIAYTSALKIHKLLPESPSGENDSYTGANASDARGDPNSRVFVVTSKQMKPAVRTMGGITIQFVLHNPFRFFGMSNIWINQHEEAMVSDVEKTIVDIATRPQLCGGITVVGKVLVQAKNMLNQDKLFYYFMKNNSKSAKKRFLFLTDLLNLDWTREHESMLKELGTGISLLDPSVPNQGKVVIKFGLKINVDSRQIEKDVLQLL